MGAVADAIRELIATLGEAGVEAKPRYVKDDIVELRAVFKDDLEFARALRSVSKNIGSLRSAKAIGLDHDLEGWWRIKFSSGNVDRADLRIIFRFSGDAIELRAFGHRHDPESIYRKSTNR